MYPILFTLPDWLPLLGGLPIYSFGFMLGLGVVTGWIICRRLAVAAGMRAGIVDVVLLAGVTGGLFGARAVYLVAHRGQWRGFSSLMQLGASGQILIGGLLLGVLIAYVAAKLMRADFWSLADHAAPGVALGIGLGRVGCFLFGCDFGRETTSAIGIRFPMWPAELVAETGRHGSPAFMEHFGNQAGSISEHVATQAAGLHAMAQTEVASIADAMGSAATAVEAKFQTLGALVMNGVSNPVVPTQLFAVLAGFAAFAGLIWLHRRRAFAGQVVLALGCYYGLIRLLLDFTRGDPGRSMIGPLSLSQVVGAALFVIAGLVWLRRRRSSRPVAIEESAT